MHRSLLLYLGILIPEIFAILVMMALVTTFLTGPLLHLIDKIFHARSLRTKPIIEP
ncbi:MAG: hypothetical protein IT260_17050 [Saprospiraceae bacterium]|nr:hypothetical protein [Saprospiraceae bacterium]